MFILFILIFLFNILFKLFGLINLNQNNFILKILRIWEQKKRFNKQKFININRFFKKMKLIGVSCGEALKKNIRQKMGKRILYYYLQKICEWFESFQFLKLIYKNNINFIKCNVYRISGDIKFLIFKKFFKINIFSFKPFKWYMNFFIQSFNQLDMTKIWFLNLQKKIFNNWKNFNIKFIYLYILNMPIITWSMTLIFFVKLYNLNFDILMGNILTDEYIIFSNFSLFYYTLFLVILNSNLSGMIPYAFTVTSHLSVTMFLSNIVFWGATIISLQKYTLGMFSLFFPVGVSLIIILFLIFVETLSYMMRLFSLGIRLFANLMAGHTLMKILSLFSWSLFYDDFLTNIVYNCLSIIPTIIIFLVTFLEIAIGFLQAYVFITLSIIYTNDGLNISH